MLEIHWKLWIERDGRSVFGDGRARLLEAIASAGSLSAGARELGIPYRTAWKHLNAMERGFGRKLVERRTGGRRGGGCRLTAAGRRVLGAYQKLRDAADEALGKLSRDFLDAT
jgi:molybdate transport system regulatory protein